MTFWNENFSRNQKTSNDDYLKVFYLSDQCPRTLIRPDPKVFFNVNSQVERRLLLEPLYLCELIEYVQHLEQYRRQNRRQIQEIQQTKQKNFMENGASPQPKIQFEEKLRQICSLKPNSLADKNNGHCYRNQLKEIIHLDADEIDQVIMIIEHKLNEKWLYQLSKNADRFGSGALNVNNLNENWFKFNDKNPSNAIDLAFSQQNISFGNKSMINHDFQEESLLINVDGYMLPLAKDFNQMNQNKQNWILQDLPEQVRGKYLNICWKYKLFNK